MGAGNYDVRYLANRAIVPDVPHPVKRLPVNGGAE